MNSYRKIICFSIGWLGLAPWIARAQTTIYTISTVVGNGTAAYTGDGGAAVDAQLNNPCQVAVDQSGNLYIADTNNQRVRKVSGGIINTIAGTGTGGYAGDGAAATSALISDPCGVAVDHSGDVYFSQPSPSTNSAVREVLVNGNITTVAGTSLGAGYSGDSYLAVDAQVNGPTGLTLDGSSNLYIADSLNNRIREIQAANSNIYTVAGNGDNPPLTPGSGVIAWYTSLNNPEGVAVDSSGNLYIADTYDHCVREVYGPNTSENHVIVTIAGICGLTGGYSGDGGPATQAQLNYPRDVAVDGKGNIYIVDTYNFRIRIVTPAGIISTIAGTGRVGYTGDGKLATDATFSFPSGIALAPSGIIYISDTDNNVIRALTPANTTGQLLIPPIIDSITSPTVCGAYSDTAAPGSWIEIYGTDLANQTTSWSSSNFTGNVAPTSLASTKVSIAGQNAVVDYVSPTQVNVQVPLTVSPGSQPVQITSYSGTSPVQTLTVNAAQPGLCFGFTIAGTQYLTAVVGGTSTYILPASANVSVSHRPAQPGETITFFGIGFGPVSPSPPQGQLVQQLNSLTMPFEVFFGNTKATVSYAGLAPGFIGLYQFNVVVPSIAASDLVPITFALGNFAGAPTLYTSVGQ
jgi:uncharacterized protein (TIGR03437 family)